MLLMIFASRHLSACCSPSFRLRSLLRLINLAGLSVCQGCRPGAAQRLHPAGSSAGGDTSSAAGPAPESTPEHPTGPAGCAEQRPSACSLCPSLLQGTRLLYVFHGKALTLPPRHGASSFGVRTYGMHPKCDAPRITMLQLVGATCPRHGFNH